MADITIGYEVGNPCAGGGHYDLTATVSGLGPQKVVKIHVNDLAERPSNEELKASLETLTWLVAKKYLVGLSFLQVQTIFHNKQLVITPSAIP